MAEVCYFKDVATAFCKDFIEQPSDTLGEHHLNKLLQIYRDLQSGSATFLLLSKISPGHIKTIYFPLISKQS